MLFATKTVNAPVKTEFETIGLFFILISERVDQWKRFTILYLPAIRNISYKYCAIVQFIEWYSLIQVYVRPKFVDCSLQLPLTRSLLNSWTVIW